MDDLADSADSLTALLRIAGHDAESAYDGQQAVARCAAWRPEVVVMDLDMPGMDGYAAAAAMRSHATCAPRWLIALTAQPKQVAEKKSLTCGFNAFMQKPGNIGALLAIIGS